jgi:hypothetical protein
MPDAGDLKPAQPAQMADLFGQVGPEIPCLIPPLFMNVPEMKHDSLVWPSRLHRRYHLLLLAKKEPAMPAGAKMNRAEQVIVRNLMCPGKTMCLRPDLGIRYSAITVTGGA